MADPVRPAFVGCLGLVNPAVVLRSLHILSEKERQQICSTPAV